MFCLTRSRGLCRWCLPVGLRAGDSYKNRKDFILEEALSFGCLTYLSPGNKSYPQFLEKRTFLNSSWVQTLRQWELHSFTDYKQLIGIFRSLSHFED